jgi:hypothetical protein
MQRAPWKVLMTVSMRVLSLVPVLVRYWDQLKGSMKVQRWGSELVPTTASGLVHDWEHQRETKWEPMMAGSWEPAWEKQMEPEMGFEMVQQWGSGLVPTTAFDLGSQRAPHLAQ